MSLHPNVSVFGSNDQPSPLGSAANVDRELVFDIDETALVRTRLADGTASDWHHHGDRAVYGYVRAGELRLEYSHDVSLTLTIDAGGFFQIPAGVVHRATNVGSDELVLLSALHGGGTPLVEPVESPSGTADELPRVAGPDDLTPAGPLKDLTRMTPFPDADVRQVRGHGGGGLDSDWHHHGDNHVFGHLMDGNGYVEWGTGEGERVLIEEDEFFHIPTEVVHRNSNPLDEPQEYVLWLTGSEPRSITVDGPTHGTP